MLSTAETDNLLITQDQHQKACKLLSEMTTNLQASMENVKTLTQQVKDAEFDSKKGLSLLDLKNNTFLGYMSNLMFTTLLKLSGESLNKHPVIDRLIEQRVVFERLGPYENKLKNKVREYLKVENEDASKPGTEEAEEQAAGKGLSTEDFAAGDTDVEDEQTDDEEGIDGGRMVTDEDGVRTYRVPKVSQNKFPDEEETEKKAKAARLRLLNSAMMQDALYEHSLDPDVIHHSSALQRKAIKKREEITKYEEDNLKRVHLSKRDRAEMRATSTAGAMSGELLGFSDLSALSGGGASEDRPAKKRRTSGGGKGKGKKKGGKKRR